LASDNLLELGRIVDAYGLKGWIKINPINAKLSDSVLIKLKTWWVEKPAGNFSAYPIASARAHGQTVVALPVGFADRNQAEAMIGASVWARRDDFPKPAIDEYYWADLIGCRVVDPDGVHLGTVRDLQDHGAHAILEFADAASPETMRLLPFVATIVSRVDLEQREIHVEWRADFFD
jgi:16S rRNA processing protein RimM